MFDAVSFQVDGKTFWHTYNTLLEEPSPYQTCISPILHKLIDGKPVIPDEVFMEIPIEEYLDYEYNEYRWADHNPEDPDDTG